MKKVILAALVLLSVFSSSQVFAAGEIEPAPPNVFIEAGSDYGSGATVGDVSMNSQFNMPLGAGAGEKDLKYLIQLFTDLLNRLVPLIFAMAVVVILWGIAQSISGNEDKRKAGKDIILWGVVGLFAMLSIWGLVNILVGTFQLDNNPIRIPRV